MQLDLTAIYTLPNQGIQTKVPILGYRDIGYMSSTNTVSRFIAMLLLKANAVNGDYKGHKIDYPYVFICPKEREVPLYNVQGVL